MSDAVVFLVLPFLAATLGSVLLWLWSRIFYLFGAKPTRSGRAGFQGTSGLVGQRVEQVPVVLLLPVRTLRRGGSCRRMVSFCSTRCNIWTGGLASSALQHSPME